MFVANDEMAIGLLRGMAEAGRAVPEEVSVVGMDDIPVAAYLSPPLTTMRQDFEAIASHALDLLIDQIENAPGSAMRDDLPAQLVLRRSTTPPRSKR